MGKKFHGKHRRDDDRYSFKVQCLRCNLWFAQSRLKCPNCGEKNIERNETNEFNPWLEENSWDKIE